MNSPTNTQKFSVGYRKWALWLMIIFYLIWLMPITWSIFYLLSPEGLSHPSLNQNLNRNISLGLAAFSMLFAGNIYTIVAELRRSGNAVKIDHLGIHLWRATSQPIPWSDIEDIEIFDMNRGSRFILIKLKSKVREYPSPYSFINIGRYLSLRNFTGRLKMFLDGVACDNEELRQMIDHYRSPTPK